MVECGPSLVLIDAGEGTPDGFRVDTQGNLWCGWGMGGDKLDGVRVFSRAGSLSIANRNVDAGGVSAHTFGITTGVI